MYNAQHESAVTGRHQARAHQQDCQSLGLCRIATGAFLACRFIRLVGGRLPAPHVLVSHSGPIRVSRPLQSLHSGKSIQSVKCKFSRVERGTIIGCGSQVNRMLRTPSLLAQMLFQPLSCDPQWDPEQVRSHYLAEYAESRAHAFLVRFRLTDDNTVASSLTPGVNSALARLRIE